MFPEDELRTGAWYGDQPLRLTFPGDWDVTVLRPRTPPPLTIHDFADILEHPLDQLPIRELCRGKSRPLVIVDDLNRPTPAFQLMPCLLKHFRDAGIPSWRVRVVMATGTHGAPRADAMLKKIGREAASSCQVFVHDSTKATAKVGTTSQGTPVFVNEEVASSDILIGIGGVYPNHTAGFGGGSKLALGVLGIRTITQLHYRHGSVRWGSPEIHTAFRQELDEIAHLVGLRTIISLQVNMHRQVVHMACGNHFLYYADEVDFARRTFQAPRPENANVVISNAYPSDMALTFARMKGMTPLDHCAAGVSRIAIAPCHEGLGHHGLFPFMNAPRWDRARQIHRLLSVMTPREITRKVSNNIYRELKTTFRRHDRAVARNRIHLYRQPGHSQPLPSNIPGMDVMDSWAKIIDAIRFEQGGRRNLKVLLYACAPLQCLTDIERPGREIMPIQVGVETN